MATSTDPRLKILFVMIQMAMGGSERLVLDLVRNMDPDRFAPSVAWFANQEPLPEFATLGIPLHHVPKAGRIGWHAAAELARIVRRERIDVLNAHHFMPFVYAYAAGKVMNRCAVVYTEHSASDVRGASGKWRTIGSYLARRTDAAVGISDEVSATLAAHLAWPRATVHTIENGVDLRRFEDQAVTRCSARARLGLSPDDVAIGHVANFKRNKNHLFLLRAFRELLTAHPQAKLVLVGQGFQSDPENSEEDVRQYVADNGLDRHVKVLGYRSDVADILHALDAACLVSHKEGLPLSLIEAMAAALPVVGTDIDGIRAVIRPGINGWLVRPDDVQGLAEALRRLVLDEDVRGRLGAASRTIARERYSLTRCVDQTERLFRAVARATGMASRVAREGVA